MIGMFLYICPWRRHYVYNIVSFLITCIHVSALLTRNSSKTMLDIVRRDKKGGRKSRGTLHSLATTVSTCVPPTYNTYLLMIYYTIYGTEKSNLKTKKSNLKTCYLYCYLLLVFLVTSRHCYHLPRAGKSHKKFSDI